MTNYDKDYKIWQFSDKGIVDGINGFVDLDVLYKWLFNILNTYTTLKFKNLFYIEKLNKVL